MEERKDAEDTANKPSLLTRLNPLKNRRKPPIPTERQVCPEYKAGFFSLLTFSWMSHIMAVGYQRPLELNDVWRVNPDRSTYKLAAELRAAFCDYQTRGASRPLARAMIKTFRTDLLVGGLASLLATAMQTLIPFVVKYVIAFAARAYYAEQLSVPSPPIGEGIGLVLGIMVMQILGSIGNNHFFYRGMIVGGQVRSALISIIFDKAMTISGRAKAGGKKPEPPSASVKPGSEDEKEHYRKQLGGNDKRSKKNGDSKEEDIDGWSNGRIVNLMSVDTYRCDVAAGWLHLAWTAPLAMLVTIALLIVNLSYSALTGIGLFFLSVPAIAFAMVTMFKSRKAINKLTDERVSLTQEVLQAIRFVKFYSWEADFMARVGSVRRREIGAIRRLLSTRNAINALGSAVPVFSSMLAFITFSLTKHPLNPAPIFSSLALFNGLRMPLVVLPMVLGLVTDALQSISRIEQFLLAEDGSETSTITAVDERGAFALDIRDASFTWEQRAPPSADESLKILTPEEIREAAWKAKETKMIAKKAEKARKKALKVGKEVPPPEPEDTKAAVSDPPPFTIDNITLRAGPSELIAVVGGVGSGKSSLLAALAGEMRQTTGSSSSAGRRALCPQVAWIQNASVRENIVFGGEFDQEKYDRVVDACSLGHDLRILPHGSSTEIGERGINLSGGQKHRISLARAIYFDADIVLLDDPLAAVDAHVGAHIMEHAICGLLRDKFRVLATHQLQVLPRCDRVVIMDGGKIAACDTFSNLMASNETFQKLMAGVDTDSREMSKDESQREGNKEDGDDALLGEQVTLKEPQEALMQEEDRNVRGVPWSVYVDYWKSTGSVFIPPLVIFTLCLAQGTNMVTNVWLAWWSGNQFGFSTGAYIGIYGALGVVQALLMFISTLGFSIFGTEASKRMLHRALLRVLHAPVSFFDTTPLGRITNRLSKDVDVMDNNLTESMRMAAFTAVSLIGVVALTLAYYPLFAAALLPLCAVYVLSAGYYRTSARELKRHEAVLRSAVFARFGEAVAGAPTLRAYGVADAFSRRLTDTIDEMDGAYYLTFANQRWLCVRLDAIAVLFLVVTGVLVVTNRFSVGPGVAGLVLSYLVSVSQLLQFSVRQVADVQNNMNATERVHHYGTRLDIEGESQKTVVDVPDAWPDRGHIVLRDAQMRYREGLPLVLHGLNLDIRAGERLGIVGRTGAGKSSIMTALFRLAELSSGSITIDGVDVSTVRLGDLRSRLSIIPQDPTLFRGTVRSNLDPFGTHTDLELWTALRQAHLVDSPSPVADAEITPAEEVAEKTRITLDSPIDADGANFSLGQRQLMALARALVRNSRVVVCDEATSSIDFESDAAVQRAMAQGFGGRTVLCIAHRLKTVIGYDRVCVVEDGQVVELDRPLALFDRGGVFWRMCERGLIGRAEIEQAQVDLGRAEGS